MIETNYCMYRSIDTITGLLERDVPVLGRGILAVLPSHQSRLAVAPFEIGHDGRFVIEDGSAVKVVPQPRYAVLHTRALEEDGSYGVDIDVFGGVTGVHMGLSAADLVRSAGRVSFEFTHGNGLVSPKVGLSFMDSRVSKEEVHLKDPYDFQRGSLDLFSSYYDAIISRTLSNLTK